VFRLLDIFCIDLKIYLQNQVTEIFLVMFFGLQQPFFDFLARAGLFGCGFAGLPALDTAFCAFFYIAYYAGT
jgi:hypothetical protein